MKNTIVSIITPVFNREAFLPETIQSVTEQTFKRWELILVDDGSTDNSLSIVSGYIERDNRIKLIRRGASSNGACVCRNIGATKAKGDYILYLDSDDLIEPFCLGQRLRAMEQNADIAFGIFPSLIFKEKPFDTNRWWNVDKETPELERHLYLDAICQTSGAIFRKETALQYPWSEDVSMWQDIDFFLRLYIDDVPYKKFFDLPPDMHYRVHGSLSRKDYFSPEKIKGRELVFRNTVSLLTDKKSELLGECRYMGGAVISGYIRRRMFDKAAELIDWSLDKNVITREEAADLKAFALHTRFRLYKIDVLNKRMKKRLRTFEKESTIGKISYK